MITSNYAPFVALGCGFAMCYYYPSLKQWSTARGDTTIIIGTVAGFSVGAYLNNHLGYLERPAEPPLYDIHFPNALGYVFGVVRTILGLLMFLACRQILKKSLLRFICYLNGRDYKDPQSKRLKAVELPYNYFSYFVLGMNIAFMSPFVFRLLNIERDYSYTEL
jgi:sphingosine-1-phosphate phosphatase 1